MFFPSALSHSESFPQRCIKPEPMLCFSWLLQQLCRAEGVFRCFDPVPRRCQGRSLCQLQQLSCPGSGQDVPVVKWCCRVRAGSSHFLTSWVLQVAELAWKVFTKSLDFLLNISAYPFQPSALLQLLLTQPNPANCSLVWGLRGWREHGDSAFASGAKDFCSKIVQDAVPNSMHVGYL